MKTKLLNILALRLLGLVFITVLQGLSPVQAQKEANNWYFGFGAGINFNYNPPRAVYGGVTKSHFGHASMSDANGNLLFYTGLNLPFFDKLWGPNHQPLPNSQGIPLGTSKNTLIVPWPGQPQKYYVFISFPGSFESYSIVDMALNNGLGAINTVKNQYLTHFRYADVVGVKHRNNRDYWIIYQDTVSNKFQSFLIGPGGINTTPVNSTVNTTPVATNLYDNLKASPDGKIFAFCKRFSSNTRNITLFNFDAATGLVSFRGILPDIDAGATEFSPDGSKLYARRDKDLIINKGFPVSLVQYDLDLPTTTDIFNSAVVLWQDTLAFGTPEVHLQVGPDGKIYMTAGESASALHVINRPTLKGTACRFVPNDFDLDPLNVGNIECGYRLPTFIQSYFYRPKITMQQTCFGDTAFFALGNPAYVDSVEWNFGDPASGMHNTSTLFNPKHFYVTPGPKQVQAIVHFNFTSDTLTQTVYIPVSIVKPNLGNDTTLCAGDTLRLNAYQPGASYEWQDSINTDSVYVVTKPGMYWVSVSNGCGTLGDSIVVNFNTPLSLTLPNDTTLCPGQTLTLQVNAPGGNLLWSDSTSTSTFTVSEPGTYWAELRNACGSWRDSITVNYIPVVKNNWLPKDTILCSTQPFTINGSNPAALRYLWQDGTTAPTFTAQTSGTYWLEITTACTTVRDSIRVTINKLPETRFSDTTICSGDSFRLTAPKALSYRWSTGDTSQSILISKAGQYKVELETVKGCFFSDSLKVKTERCFKTAFIPNIVTPNNDKLNDQFEPKGLEAGEYELSIYNRWGSLIYQQENYTNQWPDKKLSDGTYYYLLRNQQTGKTYKGWVEVAK